MSEATADLTPGSTGDAGPRRIPLPLLLGPFAVFLVCSYVADASWPGLITEHPLLLIALSSKNRYLILAAPQLDFVPFFVVGFLRLIATDPIAFVLGRQYGPAAITWIESKSSKKDAGDAMIRKMERWFTRASALFIIVAPSAIWCMMAGAGRMRTSLFVACNAVGTVGRLLLIWWIGEALEAPIDSFLDVVKDFQLPLLAITFTLVAFQTLRRRRPDAGGTLDVEGEVEARLTEAE